MGLPALANRGLHLCPPWSPRPRVPATWSCRAGSFLPTDSSGGGRVGVARTELLDFQSPEAATWFVRVKGPSGASSDLVDIWSRIILVLGVALCVVMFRRFSTPYGTTAKLSTSRQEVRAPRPSFRATAVSLLTLVSFLLLRPLRSDPCEQDSLSVRSGVDPPGQGF